DHEVREHLVPLSADHLARALRRWLSRARTTAEAYSAPPVISLGAMIQRLLSRLPGRVPACFGDVVGAGSSRSERIVGFIALLTLLRRNVVVARQAAIFGEIEIEKLEPVVGANLGE
ncbi:MAG TPA: hypothetical protein VKU87_10445, partial [Thermomicrobiaceae bacterium]|nr:hypothetical protein [Thermomicrobiaceae bacterium]